MRRAPLCEDFDGVPSREPVESPVVSPVVRQAASPAASARPAMAPDPARSPSLILLGSSLSFAVMAFAAKLASQSLPGDQVAFLRFALMLAPFLVRPRLVREALTYQRLDLLAYRGVFGGVAVLLYFLAIEKIPVGMATLLNYSSPVWSVTLPVMLPNLSCADARPVMARANATRRAHIRAYISSLP